MPAQGDETAYSGPPRSDWATCRCLRCGALTPTNSFGGRPLHEVDANRAIFVPVCISCRLGSVAIKHGTWEETGHQRHGRWVRKGTETWWPAGGNSAPIEDDAGVPEEALRFWGEASRCMSVEAFHAAAVMLRNVLTAIANDVGGANVQQKHNLDQKLQELASVKPQTAFLLDYMSELRQIGNAGAHPENWPEVEQVNAETASSVARYLIEVLYEQPARISRGIMRKK